MSRNFSLYSLMKNLYARSNSLLNIQRVFLKFIRMKIDAIKVTVELVMV